MKKALLIIDYTNDFIADNGSLTCGKPAQALEDYLIELANKFYDNGDYVIFPTDGHTGDTFSPEYKLFPPHNIVGTPGSGFGPSGEGYFRLTAFGSLENTKRAMERIKAGEANI